MVYAFHIGVRRNKNIIERKKTMGEISFNKYGYADAEDLCAPLVDRESEKPGMWIRRMSLLAVNKIELRSVKRREHADDAMMADHDVVSHKPLQNARVLVYKANRVGLTKLANAAIRVGKKVVEAQELLERLKVLETASEEVPEASALIGALALKDDVGDFTSLKDLESEDPFSRVCMWKNKEVVLSSALAKNCGLETKYVNRQVKACENKGTLTEGADFFRLTDNSLSGFCEVHDFHRNHPELTNGIYLLTLPGALGLVGHFKTDKAAAIKNSANLAAAAMMEIERGGTGSTASLMTVIQALSHQCEQTSACCNELRSELEESRETSKTLLSKLDDLKKSQSLVNVTYIEEAAKTAAKKIIDTQIYKGEKYLPQELIGNKERREKHFPGINPDTVSKFLLARGHPSSYWLKDDPISGLRPVTSYERKDMDKRAAEFFSILSFVKKSECNYIFSLSSSKLPGMDPITVEIQHKRTDRTRATPVEVERELNFFMKKFCQAHSDYEFTSEGLVRRLTLSPMP